MWRASSLVKCAQFTETCRSFEGMPVSVNLVQALSQQQAQSSYKKSVSYGCVPARAVPEALSDCRLSALNNAPDTSVNLGKKYDRTAD